MKRARATKRSKQSENEPPQPFDLPAGLHWKFSTIKHAFQVELDSAPNSNDFAAQERFWEVELSPYVRQEWDAEEELSTELLLQEFPNASDKVLNYCKLQIIEQKAARENGLVGRGFLYWLVQRLAELEIQDKMLELATMLKCMGITKWELLMENQFVKLLGSDTFRSTHPPVTPIGDMFHAIIMAWSMQQYLPINLQDKHSMYNLFYRTTLTRSAITSKKMAREQILLEFDRICLTEQVFRIAGSSIGNFLGPVSLKLVAQTFSSNAEVCQALASNSTSLGKAEGLILQCFKMSKPELLNKLALHGVNAKLYHWLVSRAARFSSRHYTIGTRSVIEEFQVRFNESSLFTYTFDCIRRTTPDLANSYVIGEFMGTHEELELYAKLKLTLQKANVPDQFDTIWNEIQEMATQTSLKWAKIRLAVFRNKKDSRGKKLAWKHTF
ncbi:hypothetical protein BASA81_005562 [Batrachochytrium salamandrivorans]|nr:hypothetical protein BASA81_005562 [Batrachochytrium salamandrivorans]